MLQSINWILSIVGAVLGIAGTLVLGACLLLVAALVKKLPLGIRSFISASAAVLVAFTLFRGLAVQSIYVFVGRSLISGGLGVKFADVALAVSSLLFMLEAGNLLILCTSRVRFEGVGAVKRASLSNDKKMSSPSFSLKVSSVLLQ